MRNVYYVYESSLTRMMTGGWFSCWLFRVVTIFNKLLLRCGSVENIVLILSRRIVAIPFEQIFFQYDNRRFKCQSGQCSQDDREENVAQCSMQCIQL